MGKQIKVKTIPFDLKGSKDMYCPKCDGHTAHTFQRTGIWECRNKEKHGGTNDSPPQAKKEKT
ncbi:MAG: hypothetical protein ACE5H1_02450 [Thermodesulfobacteriota bacterium]